ncbi:chromosome partitioning protein ParA [Enterovibrio norvegicus FF-162]|nr:chromosome partitioning protein ParA [Enterovibrio norvegicus FF-162]
MLNADYQERFPEVFSAEEECKRLKNELEAELLVMREYSENRLEELEALTKKAGIDRDSIQSATEKLKRDYREKKKTYDLLEKEVALYKESVDLAEFGFYSPQFEDDCSEDLKEGIRDCRDSQKEMLRDDIAIYCKTDWSVGSSRAEGKKMVSRMIKMTARAFNNECDSAISKCNWRNITQMRERIKKSFDAINKLNEKNDVHISREYLSSKLNELDLSYSYHQKKQQEKEEQAEIRAQMREEAKIEAEIKKAEAEAIKEEKRYQKALDEARKELEKANDEERAALADKVSKLEADLEEAHCKHERAKSMAEQTKQGHVYIISNVGSFGDGVYKIGMTRRLEPMDRVKELGDASVPFTFDVHAMIHCKDAPAMESMLHKKFDERRLNMVNRRKEFFKVDLKDIKAAVQEFDSGDIDFIETAVARDYYETQAMLKQIAIADGVVESNNSLFAEEI